MKKGSITIEAALVLPIFLCVVISVVFLIKVVYTHELIQHAITETADEMAASGYIFHISGLGELNNGLDSGMENRAQIFKDHINNVFDSFDSLGELFDVNETIIAVASNPVDELKNIACLLAGGVYDDLKTEVFTPLVKLNMNKYLTSGSGYDADERLRTLNVDGGFDGLDFNESCFFSDENNEIDIVVRYSIDLPVPVKVLPKLVMVQRATARAWMGGDEASPVIGDVTGDEDNIWTLDNFTRGRKIRSLFGANMPFNFPVIAKFENGKAVMIKSMDITADSYKNPVNLIKTLDKYLSDLYGFKGQEEPWGSSNTVIRPEDIKQKELFLVIPQNQLSPQTEQVLADFSGKASSMGIKLVIERYGLKKVGEQN